jgi:hypothetical protein
MINTLNASFNIESLKTLDTRQLRHNMLNNSTDLQIIKPAHR